MSPEIIGASAKTAMWPRVLMGAVACFMFGVPAAQASEAGGPLTLAAISNGSWISTGIILTSVLTAWLLNYSAPKVRVIGTLLAALGCFAIVGWFVFVKGTGILADPRPNVMPLDSLKPSLLWMQAAAALFAGIALVMAAFVQKKNNRTLELSNDNEAAKYGRVSRMLHWTIAILILVMLPMGIFTTMIPEGVWYRQGYYVAHQTIGVSVLVLVVVRLVWSHKSTKPELDPSLRPWERKLAHAAHVGLYVFMIGLPLTGYLMTSFNGFPTFLFGARLSSMLGESETFAMVFGMLHKYLFPYLLYIVLGSHILGALKHKFLDKHEDALSRMVS